MQKMLRAPLENSVAAQERNKTHEFLRPKHHTRCEYPAIITTAEAARVPRTLEGLRGLG